MHAALLIASLACIALCDDYNLWYYRGALTVATQGDRQPGSLVAWAHYEPTYNKTGWDVLRIEAVRTLFPYYVGDAYYYVGYMEGYLTHDRIHYKYLNTVNASNATMTKVPGFMEWVAKHRDHMQRMARNTTCGKYCERVAAILQQVRGMAAGYAKGRSESELALTEWDIFFNNFGYEGGDVVTALEPERIYDDGLFHPRHPTGAVDGDTCSALIRVTPHDLFVAHNTWSSLSSMLRQYKTYVFDTTVIMSAYPGMVYSVNDWYMTSNGMAVIETTLSVENYTLFRDHVLHNENSVSQFVRCMLANYLAKDSKTWVELFSRENSGTYNNEWMAVDMKLYTPGERIRDNTFWVAEQVPGTIAAYDKSDLLRTQGFWPSFNIAVFKEIRAINGDDALEKKYGTFFSATKSSRAQIFYREAPQIFDLEGMKRIMRYNEYKTDPASLIPNCNGTKNGKCVPAYSAMLSIAARGDLNPPNSISQYGILAPYVGQAPHVATDAKIISWSMMMNRTPGVMGGLVIDGPTNQNQPTYEWATSPFPNRPHYGHAPKFNFPWTLFITNVTRTW